MIDHKAYPYVYTSSQLGKYFGISIKGIEYYERKKLINPKRVGNNNQRQFNLNDTYRIFMARYLSQSGLTLNDTLDVLNASNEQIALKFLVKNLHDSEKEFARINASIEVMTHNIKLLQKVLNYHIFFEIIKSPTLKTLFLREMDGPHKSNQEQTDEYRTWNKLMPITNGSIRYRKKDILNKTSKIEPEIEMIISEKYFTAFGLKNSNRVNTIPSKTCLHTVVVGNAQNIDNKGWLNSIRSYLKENNYLLNGDIITSLLLVLDNSQKHIRYDEAWIPIKSKW